MRKNINKAEPPKRGFFIFRERKGSKRNGTGLATKIVGNAGPVFRQWRSVAKEPIGVTLEATGL